MNFDSIKSIGKKIAKKLLRHPPTQPSRPLAIHWKQVLGNDFGRFKKNLGREKKKRVLVATGTGGHAAVITLESLLGTALSLRDAHVDFLLCDERLPACLMCLATDTPEVSTFVEKGPQGTRCGGCYKPGRAVLDEAGFPILRYSDFITPEEAAEAKRVASTLPFQEISRFKKDGLAVGEHAMAGALRFYARATLESETFGEAVLRRYLEASLLTAYGMNRLLEQGNYDVAVFHHGIYVPQGIVGEVCRKKGVRVVNWAAAYRKKCFIFSHGDTYHHTLMTEPVDRWENLELTPKLDKLIVDYLKSRWEGTQDWIYFHEKPDFSLSNIAAEIGLDFDKPCIGLLTNVMWDAQLHYPANAFPNMLEWVLTTIRYFEKRPDLQLLIRVHPAEIRGTVPSRQPLVAEIEKAFPKLPLNVRVIGPESRISTYVAMGACDSVLIFGTKTGVELTSVGIPVIVAGEAWIRNKGMTEDATSVDHYEKLLDKLPTKQRMSKEQTERAKKYAFHFFFRRMIEVGCVESKQGWPPYGVQVQKLEDLMKGADPGLDVICDGILEGRDFILKYEDLSAQKGLNTQQEAQNAG